MCCRANGKDGSLSITGGRHLGTAASMRDHLRKHSDNTAATGSNSNLSCPSDGSMSGLSNVDECDLNSNDLDVGHVRYNRGDTVNVLQLAEQI